MVGSPPGCRARGLAVRPQQPGLAGKSPATWSKDGEQSSEGSYLKNGGPKN